MLLSLAPPCRAQKVVHDKQKEKQWRSMETGPWDFAPGGYYYFLHKKYSGAYLHFAWLGTSVRFRESKSNVRTIMPRRTAAEETQRQKMLKAEEERDMIEPLWKEELEQEADRAVDLVYDNYKDDFNRMQDDIADGLTYCLTKSKGRLKPQIDELQRRNDMICSSIAYIHQSGYKHGLANAKREKAYARYKKEMAELVSRVAHLVGMAQTHY